jgi:hypothetical protein
MSTGRSKDRGSIPGLEKRNFFLSTVSRPSLRPILYSPGVKRSEREAINADIKIRIPPPPTRTNGSFSSKYKDKCTFRLALQTIIVSHCSAPVVGECSV